MALRLRVTVPDGALYEHLKHLTPAGQRFELIRLATNNLNLGSLSGSSKNLSIETKEPKEEMVSKNFDSEASKTVTLVDFGDDLLGLS